MNGTKNHQCNIAGEFSKWKPHLLQDMEIRTKSYLCPTCGKDMVQKDKYDSHPHVQILNISANYSKYTFIKKESKLHKLLMQQPISLAIDICTERKLCLENQFVGLSVPVSWFTGDANFDEHFSKYGNTSGVSLYEKVLLEKIRFNGPEGNRLVLHKNVRVCDDQGMELARLPEILTKPKSNLFNVYDIGKDKFEISLKNPPKLPKRSAHPEASETLMKLAHAGKLERVLQYSKAQGYSHEPHSYPPALYENVNLFKNIHMMPKDFLEHLTSLTLGAFWCAVEKLAKSGAMAYLPKDLKPEEVVCLVR